MNFLDQYQNTVEKIMGNEEGVSTLPAELMEPVKFEPIAARRFLFLIEGIDAFLIKSVQQSPWVADKTKRKNQLIVKMHSAIAPSSRQQIEEWINCDEQETRKAVLCLLDPVGTCISKSEFPRVWIEELYFSELTYDTSAQIEYTMFLGFDKELFMY